ncbi:hypothetical protein OG264_03265 [Streptomyces xanthophaeus]|uniref:hypothetical protein n=1 Tax=Streptomyces xanthophaeus TaxID=67385 RepID=UPI00386F9898|nr:hypothetical protein OG264_03265 [Streptomyces xanthophaeus]WST64410.1 hypothetical protein OG605_35095 [Streptomyces xanthophaeus]
MVVDSVLRPTRRIPGRHPARTHWQAAREELSREPLHTSEEAVGEFLDGLRCGAGMDTAPLAPDRTVGQHLDRVMGA